MLLEIYLGHWRNSSEHRDKYPSFCAKLWLEWVLQRVPSRPSPSYSHPSCLIPFSPVIPEPFLNSCLGICFLMNPVRDLSQTPFQKTWDPSLLLIHINGNPGCGLCEPGKGQERSLWAAKPELRGSAAESVPGSSWRKGCPAG